MSEPGRPADETVVLCRCLVAGEQGATGANLREALKALRPHAGQAALEESRELVLRDLFQAGRVEPDGRRYTLAPSAAAALRRELGLGLTESAGTWTAFRDGRLTARALGLPPPDAQSLRRFSQAPGLRAAIVATAHRLPVAPYPTATEALDAFGWHALSQVLGDPLDDWRGLAFGRGAVVACLLGRDVGITEPLTPAKLLARLAAAAVGAPGPDPRALRATILRRWRAGEPPALAPVPRAPAPKVESFTEALRMALRGDGAPAGTLVLISDAYAALARRDPTAAGDLPTFKRRLLAAARERKLELSRADLAEAVDPGELRRSEIRDLIATFHYVRL
ncbi:MAG: hypothetical protein IPM29_05365 [Planctomycetes bacterium]|nr:hypothetical protein [Planctomycetota bacterium]